MSLVNTQRNVRIDSLIFWLCRYLPSVVGVAPFFTENRALAIGICLCGSGVGRKCFQVQFIFLPPKVGTFGLAPVSNFILLRYLDWSSFIIALLTFFIFADTPMEDLPPLGDEEFLDEEEDDEDSSSTDHSSNSQK